MTNPLPTAPIGDELVAHRLTTEQQCALFGCDLIDLLRREGTYSGVWFAEHLLQAADAITGLHDRIESLHAAIEHGDQDHRAWLKEAITAHFAGEPVPAPRGQGNAHGRIEKLEAALSRLIESADSAAESANIGVMDKAIDEARAALAKDQGAQ